MTSRTPRRTAPLWHRVISRVRHTRLIQWLWTNRVLLIYSIASGKHSQRSSAIDLHRNALEDLERFHQTESWLTREQFLTEARKRLANGLDIYTAVENNVLVHYCWVVPHQRRGWFPYVQQHYNYPEGSCVYFNAYTHPSARGRGLYTDSLMRVVEDALNVHQASYVYLAIESDNLASRSVVEQCGFACADILFERRRIGHRNQGHIATQDYFSKKSTDG